MTFFSTFAVGQGVNTIMLAFLSAATLCPFDIRREGLERLTGWMAARRLSVYISSATLLRNLMRTLAEASSFRVYRTVRVGGERVLPSDVTEGAAHISVGTSDRQLRVHRGWSDLHAPDRSTGDVS